VTLICRLSELTFNAFFLCKLHYSEFQTCIHMLPSGVSTTTCSSAWVHLFEILFANKSHFLHIICVNLRDRDFREILSLVTGGPCHFRLILLSYYPHLQYMGQNVLAHKTSSMSWENAQLHHSRQKFFHHRNTSASRCGNKTSNP